MRKLIAAGLFFALVSIANAEIQIDKNHVVKNWHPGYCVWTSLETLGKHHNNKLLFNLAKNRSEESNVKEWNGKEWVPLPYVMVERGDGQWVKEERNVGSDWGTYRKLKSLNVKFKIQFQNNRNDDIIKYAIKNNLGCVAAVRSGAMYKNSSSHAFIIVDYNDKNVRYIDTNDPDSVYEATRTWFDNWFNGFVVVIEKE